MYAVCVQPHHSDLILNGIGRVTQIFDMVSLRYTRLF